MYDNTYSIIIWSYVTLNYMHSNKKRFNIILQNTSASKNTTEVRKMLEHVALEIHSYHVKV